jgi:hypothetical protein
MHHLLFCIVTKFLEGAHTSFLQNRNHLLRHPPCGLIVELQHTMDMAGESCLFTMPATAIPWARQFSLLTGSTSTPAYSIVTAGLSPVQCCQLTLHTPFLNFPLHSHTCCGDKHVLRYCNHTAKDFNGSATLANQDTYHRIFLLCACFQQGCHLRI